MASDAVTPFVLIGNPQFFDSTFLSGIPEMSLQLNVTDVMKQCDDRHSKAE
jgi:hypothetical protein